MSAVDPSVSIIIPTYNRAHLISKPILSVLNQTYQNFELIVVDDCSTDNTEEIVKQFKDARIRYIRHEQNLRSSRARNTGIQAANGDYVAFLDSDDEWLPEKLEKQVAQFQKSDPQVGVIYTWLCAVDETRGIERIRKSILEGWIRDELIYFNFVGTPSTVIVKRECIDRAGEFDPDLVPFEDLDMWVRIAEHYKFSLIPEVLVRYGDQFGPERNTTNSKLLVEGALILIKRYHQPIDLLRSSSQIGNLSNSEKGEYLSTLGIKLICNGGAIAHREAIKIGRSYLLASLKVQPINLGLLGHYLISLLGGNVYLTFTHTKNRTRRWLSRHLLGLKQMKAI